MSDSSAFDLDSSHSPAEIGRLVETMVPGWTAVDAMAAEEGTDAVYFVTVETPEGSREAVLKICEFVSPEAFRPEPRLLALMDRRTSIPVPSVYGVLDDHDELPAPAFLMERRQGAAVQRPDLDRKALGRVAREAGRHLGEVHAVGTFEEFGAVRLARDAGRPASVELPDGDGLAVGDPFESWRAKLAETARSSLDDLHERFADLAGSLRDALEPRLAALPEPEPVLIHGDYRLGNLLVDPETGATRAVLDWGNCHTGHAESDLTSTEQYLCGYARPGSERRRFVREHLYAGYAETNQLDRDEGFGERREAYLLVSRLFPLVWFDLWYGDADVEEREEVAARHREAIEARIG